MSKQHKDTKTVAKRRVKAIIKAIACLQQMEGVNDADIGCAKAKLQKTLDRWEKKPLQLYGPMVSPVFFAESPSISA